MGVKLVASSGGSVELVPTNTASNFTVTVPAVTASMLTDSSGVMNIGSGQIYKDASGNVGIGTSSPSSRLTIGTGTYSAAASGTTGMYTTATGLEVLSDSYFFGTRTGSIRMVIDTSGNLLVGRTAVSGFTTSSGLNLVPTDGIAIGKSTSVNWGSCIYMNRMAAVGDGTLVEFAESGTIEGTISVSGTTVSYNGGHLSRYAQTTIARDDSLVKGTVLSNLDEMNVYTDSEGNPITNEQLNKVKVSDVEGDVNVAGVFVNWSHDDAHDVDEINMAMTGDMIIRIAQGVTVVRGDLLMSAGDGTAKPQDDDIVRSKTVAKVTSTNVTCTYADGSYCVPCVLMAC